MSSSIKVVLILLFIFTLGYSDSKAQYVPEEPEQLNGYVFYNDAVYLYWYHRNLNTVDGFRIYYSISPDTNKVLAKVVSPPLTASFVEGLTPGTNYTFYVAAYNVYGQSGYSNPHEIQLPIIITGTPEPPTDLHLIKVTASEIIIGWQDNSNNEYGFKIAKSVDNDTSFIIRDSVGPDVLSYQEIGLTPNSDFFYKVCAYNLDGYSEYSNTIFVHTTESGMSVVNQHSTIPDEFYLGSNFPNPFNPSTTFRFGMNQNDNVEISVYDVTGKLVDIVFSGNLQKGDYTLTWAPGNLKSGVYFYTMVTSGFKASGKMMLLK